MPLSDRQKESIRDAIAQTQVEVAPSGTANVQVQFGADLRPFLTEAARRRGISLSGYMRRAAFAFVAADLGADPRDLFAMDLPLKYGPAPDDTDRDIDGERFGRWEVGGHGA